MMFGTNKNILSTLIWKLLNFIFAQTYFTVLSFHIITQIELKKNTIILHS